MQKVPILNRPIASYMAQLLTKQQDNKWAPQSPTLKVLLSQNRG